MALERIGKTFKNKTGKSTTLILSEADLETLRANLQPNEKYGLQVRLIITGTAGSEYGHGVSLVTDDVEGNEVTGDDNQKHQPISEDDLTF